MARSGYKEGERNMIMREGIRRYDNLVEQEEKGIRPLYRYQGWEEAERCVKKKVKQKNWYGEEVDSILFVQPTKGEVLKKRIQEEARRQRLNIKVVEESGRTIKSMVQRSDPSKRKGCWDEQCVVCETKEEGKCRKESIGYEIWCQKCKEEDERHVMHGESGRCAYVRCGEHIRDYKRKAKTSNLWEHSRDIHGGEMVNYGCKVVGYFPGDILGRQLDEALRIDGEPGKLLNDKREWIRPAGVRINVERMQL